MNFDLPIGQSIDDDSKDYEDAVDYLKDRIGYAIFCAALARFMPPNSAVLYDEETISEYLDSMEVDTVGLEDVVEDLILTNIYDDEEGTCSIMALRPETFFEELTFGDEVTEQYVEALLKDGKMVQFGRNPSKEDAELTTEEEDDEHE